MAKVISHKIVFILSLGLVLRLCLVMFSAWHPDLNNHTDWGIRFLSLGPEKFYENIFWGVSWPNQPFGSILIFGLFTYLKNILFSFIEILNQNIPIFPSFIIPYLEQNLHAWMVKLPFILSDIGLSYLIYRIVKEFKPQLALLAASLFLFNPVIIYNSTIWGQTDSLINLLTVSGIYLTFKKKYFWGIILFLSSFLFKLSLIIYLPIFGLLLLKQIQDWRKFIAPILFFVFFVYCLAIPFTFGDKTPFDWLWYLYNNRVLVRQGSMLNGNAFNFWFFIFGLDFSRSEFTSFLSLTYQSWSRLALGIFLAPVCLKFFKSKLTLENLFVSLTLTAFGSFLILTNMHERYLYPIFPLITVLVFLRPTFISTTSYLTLSLVSLLNLYNLWFYPDIPLIKQILVGSNFLFGRFLSLVLIFYCSKFLLDYLKRD